ncbi:amino acid ABC transporter permease [Amycolatopsis jejuensis]|uniref:amino acid ABC transporter permease n=1 Tax=Amycolatopsis jejuensis TaxID=330084 RepID=UPI000691DE5E|nr:amino acid ABC transporter permease [Amycolatopsis jejuensis]
MSGPVVHAPEVPVTSDADSADRVARRYHVWRWVSVVVLVVLLVSFVRSAATNPRFEWDMFGSYLFSDTILDGVRITAILTVVCMLIAIVLGAVLAVMRMSSNPVLVALSTGFVWLFQGTPMLVQLLLFYNIAAVYPKLSLHIVFLPPLFEVEANTVITAMVAAVLGLGLHEAAYMAEIIRAGISGVDRGQSEAARALGMSRWHTFRRVILPQAARLIVPPTSSRTIGLLKYTSLVSVLGLGDLLYNAEQVYSQNFKPIPLLLVASLWYLAITTVLMAGQSWLERRFGRGFDRGAIRPARARRSLRSAGGAR